MHARAIVERAVEDDLFSCPCCYFLVNAVSHAEGKSAQEWRISRFMELGH